MLYLLDTHIILWWLSEPGKLTDNVTKIIEDKSKDVFISQISLMELAIKVNIGKLSYQDSIVDLLADIEKLDFTMVKLENSDLIYYSQMPLHHRDPFDRFLIAQAKSNNMAIITSDSVFGKYNIDIVIN